MSAFKDKVAPWVAVAALGGLAASVFVLFRHVGDSEPQWSRMVLIFGAIEAAGLAALGFIFGKEVNRTRAEKAENRAEGAEQAKDTANLRRGASEQNLTALIAFIEQKASAKRPSGRSQLRDLVPDVELEADVRAEFPDLVAYVG